MIMQLGIYVRVSTTHQVQAQTIEHQLTLLEAYCTAHAWPWPPTAIFRDDGYSGASLRRPGLAALRDAVARHELSHVLLTTPDRLARKYVHQALVVEELEHAGCVIAFVDRPMDDTPHDHLLLQIRGAVAEYERCLITDRTRRGRQTKVLAGTLLPWTRTPYAYRADPDAPRNPHGLTIDLAEAAIVQEVFTGYLYEHQSLWSLAKRYTDAGIPAPRGRLCWRQGVIRGILTNPVYTGQVYTGRYTLRPAEQRRSPLQPVNPRNQSRRLNTPDAWTLVSHVPAIITQDMFDQVQAKLTENQRMARRNNTAHDYLLRALVSCGQCGFACSCRTTRTYSYYTCNGHKHRAVSGLETPCPSRSVRVEVLDTLVWQDVCRVLEDPTILASALERAHGGAWLPHELQARGAMLRKAQATLERQLTRLTDAYVAEVLGLEEYVRRREGILQRQQALGQQETALREQGQNRQAFAVMLQSVNDFVHRVRGGLAHATFAQRRQIVELLVDRVVIFADEIEIRYVIPTTAASEHVQFCHLRSDYSDNQAADHGPSPAASPASLEKSYIQDERYAGSTHAAPSTAGIQQIRSEVSELLDTLRRKTSVGQREGRRLIALLTALLPLHAAQILPWAVLEELDRTHRDDADRDQAIAMLLEQPVAEYRQAAWERDLGVYAAQLAAGPLRRQGDHWALINLAGEISSAAMVTNERSADLAERLRAKGIDPARWLALAVQRPPPMESPVEPAAASTSATEPGDSTGVRLRSGTSHYLGQPGRTFCGHALPRDPDDATWIRDANFRPSCRRCLALFRPTVQHTDTDTSV
jgi:site-specific DNA recombinase